MNATTLLALIHEHLATFELPEPWSVRVTPQHSYGEAPVGVQLRGLLLPGVASDLLAWADTLTDVSAEAWRVPGGYSVHLSIRGRLADGTTVAVFDGVDQDARFGLAPGERQPVSLACLREWSTLDKGAAA